MTSNHPSAGLRRRLYLLLESNATFAARMIDAFIMALISLNVAAIVLESVESVYAVWEPQFLAFETFSVLAFTVEYLLRVWTCVEDPRYSHPVRGRLRYMASFMALVDLAAILPFYLSFFLPLDSRLLRVLRLLRIFKLTRHFQSLEILMQVIRQEASVLGSALFIMLVLATLAAGGIYAAEHDAQPEHFGSIPAAMWWAIVTLTTVGYGDVVPVTTAGKLFSGFITLLGVGMAAMPAGIIAAGFTREMQKRREIFQSSVREALEDGVISEEEQAWLEQVRRNLGLSATDAQSVTRAEYSLLCELEGSRCPHCGNPLLAEHGKRRPAAPEEVPARDQSPAD